MIDITGDEGEAVTPGDPLLASRQCPPAALGDLVSDRLDHPITMPVADCDDPGFSIGGIERLQLCAR